MARRIAVARTHDVPPGQRLLVEVDGRSIGIFNVAGRYYAVRNRCPHQGAALCQFGEVVGAVRAERPGQLSYRPDEPYLQCAWHGWEFDLATGRSWFDPQRTRLRNYPVEVLAEPGDDVELPAGAGDTGRVAGPYTAETYDVDVDDGWIVLRLRN